MGNNVTQQSRPPPGALQCPRIKASEGRVVESALASEVTN